VERAQAAQGFVQRAVEARRSARHAARRLTGELTGRLARRLRPTGAGLMVLVVLAASVGGLVFAKAALASSGAAAIPLGDYAGYVDPSGIAQFGATTGTHPTLATDYLDWSDGWSQMDSASGMGGWAGTGYRLVLAVPLIPSTSGATLADGATGAYNQYFATLAQNLVAEGVGNAILRALMAIATARGDRQAVLHAQRSAVGFYERAGFVAQGEEFLEAGIPHRTMALRLGPA